MKKLIVGLLVTLVAIAIVLLVGLQFFLGSGIVRGVNTFGPRIAGTNVELASAKISPFSGVGTLYGLKIANPPGWTAGNLFSVAEVHVDLQPSSLMGDHIVINEITIDKPEFTYETRVVASNISDLLKNIEKATGTSGATAEKNGKPVKMEVKRFVLQNGKVTVGIGGPAAVTVPLPTITLNDVGTGTGGVTSVEFAVQIMRSVTQSVAAAAVQAAAKTGLNIGGSAGETVKQAGQIIQGIMGGKK